MATVWLARDLKHDRLVALKVLRPEIAQALGPERFLREITLTAGLDHPHILPLLDSGEAAGQLFYVMPFVEGESLRERLDREKQLPLEDALQIAREVADALSYAHSRGLIHRDIKPENILLAAGHARVADFGIARAITAAGGEKLTETGIAVGTPAYMSPEQGAGSGELDGRSDIYSLGCVLYEMLAGHPPFTGTTAQEILARHSMDSVPSIAAARRTVSVAVSQALGKALEKVPADRFATAALFGEALRGAPVGVDVATSARSPRVVAIAAGLVMGLGALAWLLWPRSEGPLLDADLVAVMPFRASGAPAEFQTLALQMPDVFWMQLTGEFGPRATDPATVIRSWELAGGTVEAGLPAEAELRIAQRQGAGRLLRGVVALTGDALAITASLVEVPSGKVRVPPTTVRGRADAWPRAMDSLIVLLLARDAGVPVRELPQLARFPVQAVQAYLATRHAWENADFSAVEALLDQALAADSTFVLAALDRYRAGETDAAIARFVGERRTRLSPRDRALFRAMAGWRLGETRTAAEGIAQWESVVRGWPEWATPWYELGEELVTAGAVAGEPRWRERARAALERREHLYADGGPHFLVERMLYELAMGAPVPDTAAMRRHSDRFLAALRRRVPAARHDYVLWRLAVRLGDSAGAARWFPSADHPGGRPFFGGTLRSVITFALEDGVGMADADRAAELTDVREHAMWWARARGRHAEWLRWRDGPDAPLQGVRAAVMRVRDALFLGEAEDSSVRAAAQLLRTVAARPEPTARSLDEYVAARCWSTLWDVRHGQPRGARSTVRYLRSEAAVPYPQRLPVCAGLIEVLLTDLEGGNLRAAAVRWDSVVRPAPVPATLGLGARREDLTTGLDNLLLARLLAEVGDTMRALAAARRHHPVAVAVLQHEPATLIVDFLREEGRLAAATGDTASAIRAYNHYLALREDPDWEPWRIERDEVRQELAALVRERSR